MEGYFIQIRNGSFIFNVYDLGVFFASKSIICHVGSTSLSAGVATGLAFYSVVGSYVTSHLTTTSFGEKSFKIFIFFTRKITKHM